MLDATAIFDYVVYNPLPGVTAAYASPPSGAYTPIQIQTAYGINSIIGPGVNGAAGTGSGQTIAIVDAYNDPNIVGDAATFNTQFGLQQFNVPGGPSLTVLNQTGGATAPTDSGNSRWSVEESLDVEWAHAVAPQANIVLFEANSNSMSDMMTTVQTASDYPGVTVVSMSWGASEFPGETSYDSYFTTPGNVTFVASSGDSGSPAEYPACSPNVVGVGGTTLNLNPDNTYKSETAWSGSGGGPSAFESEPSYQSVEGSSNREAPDVAFDADPATGVAICDSYDYGASPWVQVGGTSVGAPCWSGLFAIADQFRASQRLATFGGLSQTLPLLYGPSGDFHDITSGSNGGYSAGPGYNMVTGLGSPNAEWLVPDLVLLAQVYGITATTPAANVNLTASTYTAQHAQSVTFIVSVDGTSSGTPTGSVTFEDGGTTIGVGSLAFGMTTFTDSSLAVGDHTITAVYGGSGLSGGHLRGLSRA